MHCGGGVYALCAEGEYALGRVHVYALGVGGEGSAFNFFHLWSINALQFIAFSTNSLVAKLVTRLACNSNLMGLSPESLSLTL